MINALEMTSVPLAKAPHPSHRMSRGESTVVACASNDRFGTVRTCKGCDLRDVTAGGAGSRYHDDGLGEPCRARKP